MRFAIPLSHSIVCSVQLHERDRRCCSGHVTKHCVQHRWTIERRIGEIIVRVYTKELSATTSSMHAPIGQAAKSWERERQETYVRKLFARSQTPHGFSMLFRQEHEKIHQRFQSGSWCMKMLFSVFLILGNCNRSTHLIWQRQLYVHIYSNINVNRFKFWKLFMQYFCVQYVVVQPFSKTPSRGRRSGYSLAKAGWIELAGRNNLQEVPPKSVA